MSWRATLLTAIVAALPAAGSAQWTEPGNMVEIPDGEEKTASAQCSAGVVYDDGVFNNAYSIGDGDPNDSIMVMKLALPGGTTSLDQACICFARNSGAPSSMAFDVVVYNDNGSGGQPGTFLGSVSATASAIPIFGGSQFYSVDMSGSGITLPDTSVYVGARWPGGGIFMCGDASATTTQRTNFGSGNNGASWTSLSTLFASPSVPPRAMGIRADPHTAATTCVPSATAMCLNNNRFKVQATFATASQPTTSAQVVELTDDSGYLWFFNSNNIEVVVKVLNACGVNNRYWVFAAGLTNVRVDITVTDTQTGISKPYPNPLNTPFPPIQDTNAFATCP